MGQMNVLSEVFTQPGAHQYTAIDAETPMAIPQASLTILGIRGW
jgi:hypothetical protein